VFPAFSSIPGQSVPGRFTINYPGGVTPVVSAYRYYGQFPAVWMDYENAFLGETLYAIPGELYLIDVANTRQGLTIPPPGPSWNLTEEEEMLLLIDITPPRKPDDPAVIRARNTTTQQAHRDMKRRMEMLARGRA